MKKRMVASQFGPSARQVCISFLFVFVTVLGLVSPGFSQTGAASNDRELVNTRDKGAIHIKSDLMEVMDQKGTAVFTGHVVATKDDMVIDCDKLEVFYSKQEQPSKASQEGKKAIDKIVATGHVRITKGGKVATGEKAVYEKQAEKITLSDSAQVWEGPNRVKGNVITLFLNENRSVVQGGGKEKVEAVVYPSEK
ncbi:MAG: lipopolysaccharide transport periplasmic protein LptA [Dissulfurimicrobium sp.]